MNKDILRVYEKWREINHITNSEIRWTLINQRNQEEYVYNQFTHERIRKIKEAINTIACIKGYKK
jgi:hypothetical protein